MTGPQRTSPRTVVWRRLDVEGTGLVHLHALEGGVAVEGWEATSAGAARFSVHLDEGWRTQRAWVEAVGAQGLRSVVLSADDDRAWTVDGQPHPDLDGCLDVDIAATPFTNTFPIRRLELDPGEEAEVEAVWVGIPDCAVERLGQSYRRLPPEAGPDRYEYRPVGSERGVLLEVDAAGIVLDYEGFATRIARLDPR